MKRDPKGIGDEVYRALLEQSAAGMAILDPDTGTFIVLNASMAELFGYPADALVGEAFMNCIDPESQARAAKAFGQVIELGQITVRTIRVRRRDENEVYADFTGTAFRANGRTLVSSVAFNTTDQVHRDHEIWVARDRQQRTQRAEAISWLAGEIAHDFNTDLATIMLRCDLLAEQLTQEGRPLPPDVDGIRAAAANAATLTQQLRAFARNHVVKPQIVNLNDVVSEAADSLQAVASAAVRIVTSLDPSIEPVQLDPTLVRQALSNLTTYERERMPNGGTLTIKTTNSRHHRFRGRPRPGREPLTYVKLSVSDSGASLSESELKQIFEPSVTTRNSRLKLGLDLASAYGIVKQSDGEIAVTSNPGEGTTFDLYFPTAVSKLNN